jgi:hypothetical protein
MGDWADRAVSGFARSGMWGKGGRRRPVQHVTCRYCGKGDLRWGKKKGDLWVVKDKDGNLHECVEMIEDRLGRSPE